MHSQPDRVSCSVHPCALRFRASSGEAWPSSFVPACGSRLRRTRPRTSADRDVRRDDRAGGARAIRARIDPDRARMVGVDEPTTEEGEAAMTTPMKEQASLGMPWEEQYGYAQAVKVGDTIYLSGQVSHDDEGNFEGVGDMEVQMRSAYRNIAKVLAQYDATIENVVEETLYVRDMQAAFDARVKMKDEVFSGRPLVTSTIVQIERLAFPEFLTEIRCIARV